MPNACPQKSASRSLEGWLVEPAIEPLIANWAVQHQRSRERLTAMVDRRNIGRTMLKSSFSSVLDGPSLTCWPATRSCDVS